MCTKYADTDEQVYLPGDFPGATPQVPTTQVCTSPEAARRWPA